MRPVKQITAINSESKGETVFALCEDGSIWCLQDWDENRRSKWKLLPEIPVHCVNNTIRKGFTMRHLEMMENQNRS